MLILLEIYLDSNHTCDIPWTHVFRECVVVYSVMWQNAHDTDHINILVFVFASVQTYGFSANVGRDDISA